MYTISPLNLFTAFPYRGLTFPSYQRLLQGLSGTLIGIGASVGDRPIGLVLAEIQPDFTAAKVLSIFVEATYRCQGVGTALLAELEAELIRKDCGSAYLVFPAGKPALPAIMRLLQKSGWTEPEPRMLICRCNREMLKAPWLEKYTLPSSFEIFAWAEITPADRQNLLQQQEEQQWIPTSLLPFNYEGSMEPINSVGLRYKGQVVGWVITQRPAPDTICYSCSYIRPDLQHRGRIIPLYAEAIKRQAAHLEIPHATWVVPYVHETMVQFVRQRMGSYMSSLDEYRRSSKQFTAQAITLPEIDAMVQTVPTPRASIPVPVG